MEPYNIAGIAGWHLLRLSRYTDPDADAREELAASGVDRSRVEALYPFDLRTHLPAIEAIIRGEGALEELAPMFKSSGGMDSLMILSDILKDGSIGTFLGQWSAAVHALELDRRPSKTDGETTASKVVFEWGYLLLFLRKCATELGDREFEWGSLLGQRLRWHESMIQSLSSHLAKQQRATRV
jgi:hypothetical protein